MAAQSFPGDPTQSTPPGWYPSPSHLPRRKLQRRWDGLRWTDDFSRAGSEISLDSLRHQLRLERLLFPVFALSWIILSVAMISMGGLSIWALFLMVGTSLISLLMAVAIFLSTAQRLKELVPASELNAMLFGGPGGSASPWL